MARVGGVTNVGLQWLMEQIALIEAGTLDAVDMLSSGYARLGDGHRAFDDIATATALAGTPIANIGAAGNGRLPITRVNEARNEADVILNMVAQTIDAGTVGYGRFTEVGFFNSGGVLILYYTEDTGASLGAKGGGTENVLEFNGLFTLVASQVIPATLTFVISESLQVPDNSITGPKIASRVIVNRHFQPGTILEVSLHQDVQGKLHTPLEILGIVEGMVDGNQETGITVTGSGGKLNFNVNAPSAETIFDIVKTFLSGNTESLITVTPQDGDNTIDFIVDSNIRRIFTGTSANPPTAGVRAGDLYFQRSS